MEKKKKGFSNFFAGKGFYIVLFLCIAVIGVSAWFLLYTEEEDTETMSTNVTETDVSDYTVKEDDSVATINPVIPEVEDTDVIVDEPVTVTDLEPDETTNESTENLEIENTVVPETIPENYTWPVSGTVETTFSVTALVYDKTMEDWRIHTGVDIASSLGSRVMAVADGIVEAVYEDDMYGTTVVISHSGGMKSVYSNLAAVPTVEVGDAVAISQTIGSIGSTSVAESGDISHLHFEMTINDEYVDPMDYLPKRS